MSEKQKNKYRDISGIVLLDKPTGITSSKAVQEIKRLFNASKAGHTGSLDPLASGLLPICLGEATKFTRYLLEADKTYEVVATLGKQTATGDAEGDFIKEQEIVPFSRKDLEKVLDSFLGQSKQIPSMYSAIKHKGKPLYEYARAGIEIERDPRDIYIYEIDLLDLGENKFKLHVKCSKGTYIRSLVEDIAKKLDNIAYVTYLHRLEVGPLKGSEMKSLDSFKDEFDEGGLELIDRSLKPIPLMMKGWPELKISMSEAFYLFRGQTVNISEITHYGWVVLLAEETGNFIGVGEVLSDGRVAPRRLVRTA